MRMFRIILLLCISFMLSDVHAKEITQNEFENELHIERAYIVDNYLFDISDGFNPSLKDLLIASSYNSKDNINVYEIKITENINGDIVREYRELLENKTLNSFPSIDIKYIYKGSVSGGAKEVVDNKVLTHNISRAGILEETKYNDLNIERAYILGEYIFNLDNGYNPSLKDLLIAATTVEDDDIKVYEIKKSENISGDIVEEYNELLSFNSISSYPTIKGHYVYTNNINNNNYNYLIKQNDMITLSKKEGIYSGTPLIHNNASNISGNVINYDYYDSTDCSGSALNNAPINAGNYSVKASTNDDEYYIGSSKCVTHTITKADTITELEKQEQLYNGNVHEITGASSKLYSSNLVINNPQYTYAYYSDDQCNNEIENPVSRGKYYVKSLLSGTNDYNSSESSCVEYIIGKSYITTIPVIKAGSTLSTDGYLNISTNNATLINFDNSKVWSNEIEYNSTENRGLSRFSIKVDKDFIDNEDTYYDISIEYYDEGFGNVLMQSSRYADNTMNYSEYGYGSYVEDYPMWGEREFYIKNLSFGLTNTKKWKTYTFNVTNDFFEHNIDNYIHLYFGKNIQNINDSSTIKIKSITVNKRMFKIDTRDSISNKIGNIYTDADFGMGFSVKNTYEVSKNISIKYEVFDNYNTKKIEQTFNNIKIEAGEVKNYSINNINQYGTFELVVTVECDDKIETEKIKFSKIISDLSNQNNSFIGATVHLNYGGWYNEITLNNSLLLTKKLGINNIRQGMNNGFVVRDVVSGGYSNTFGRYEDTFNTITNSELNVLPVLWNTSSNITVDNNGIITDESFEILKNEVVDYYKNLATKYKNSLIYYEMPGEWNNISYMTAEKYAEIVAEVSKKIKSIDSDAKIVALSSMDDIWSDNRDYSYYSKTEVDHQNISHDSWMAKVFKTRWLNNNNEEVGFLSFIDVISLDFYPYNYEKSIIDNYYFERINGVRELIDYYNTENKDIPITFTETGYYSADNSNETIQANGIVHTLVFALANKGKKELDNCSFTSYNFDKVYIYSLQDEAEFNKNGEGNYGIVENYHSNKIKPSTRDVEMNAKLSYVAVNMFNYLLADASLNYTNERLLGDTISENEYLLYEFKKEDKTIIALWNNNSSIEHSININDLIGKHVVIYDMFGNIINDYISDSNTININIDNTLKYVVLSN